jgi:hypothetical protein
MSNDVFYIGMIVFRMTLTHPISWKKKSVDTVFVDNRLIDGWDMVVADVVVGDMTKAE